MRMMHRESYLGLVATVLLLAGCGHSLDSTQPAASALDRVRASGVLHAAFIVYPPSLSFDPNTRTQSGIMHEVAEAVAKAMGVKLQYGDETTWATMLETVESGRADVVISGIWPSASRALRADFTRAVYYSSIYAYVPTDESRFDGNLALLDNPNVKIAVIDGEISSVVAANDYPHAKTIGLPQQADVSQLLLQLGSRKADAAFTEPAIAEAYLEHNPGTVRRITNVPSVRLFPNTFLFRKGETGLRDAFNVALVELNNSGEIARILKKYDPKGTLFVQVQIPQTP